MYHFNNTQALRHWFHITKHLVLLPAETVWSLHDTILRKLFLLSSTFIVYVFTDYPLYIKYFFKIINNYFLNPVIMAEQRTLIVFSMYDSIPYISMFKTSPELFYMYFKHFYTGILIVPGRCLTSLNQGISVYHLFRFNY